MTKDRLSYWSERAVVPLLTLETVELFFVFFIISLPSDRLSTNKTMPRNEDMPKRNRKVPSVGVVRSSKIYFDCLH
ncbi:hypothetical protein CEXT_314661 [Caerostris extrusa]|uniref:Uncharacterized protein n=1 Tax=Caerostris extrusa TaxID=172846 RepID=A0AAV4Q9F7_CAEEX|nr:hypothetical protein CEXT_314661 [Caerostris extrusa]